MWIWVFSFLWSCFFFPLLGFSLGFQILFCNFLGFSLDFPRIFLEFVAILSLRLAGDLSFLALQSKAFWGYVLIICFGFLSKSKLSLMLVFGCDWVGCFINVEVVFVFSVF